MPVQAVPVPIDLAPAGSPPPARTLADLPPGVEALVQRIGGSGAIHRRILDMGFCRGTPVQVERVAPLGDPIEIKVRGYALALRRGEAALIEVAPMAAGSNGFEAAARTA